jgi:hypothetical protein
MSWRGVLGELEEERLDGARPESGDWLLVVGAANISTLKKSSNELKGICDSTSMVWVDIQEERRDGLQREDVQESDGVVLVKGRERLAWLSQLRHPYRLNPECRRITGSPQPDANYILYYLITAE